MTLVAVGLFSSSALFRTPLRVPLPGSRNHAFQFHRIYKCTVCGLAALCVSVEYFWFACPRPLVTISS
jgi:hypothetical protein